jgi:hypothetical protein
MVIHSGIVTLDYSPTEDILIAFMPDVKQFGMSEANYCLDIIIDSIKAYDIKRLLLDSRESLVEVEEEAYKVVTKKFASDLMGTRLRKIARVLPKNVKREGKSAKIAKDLNLPVQFQSFSNPSDAIMWLKDIQSE